MLCYINTAVIGKLGDTAAVYESRIYREGAVLDFGVHQRPR